MMEKYKNIIENITDIINKNGIVYYKNKWKKPVLKKNYKNKKEFMKDINKYVKSYHNHSSISMKLLNNTTTSSKKKPKFYYDNKTKIGRIIFYEYFLDFNDKYNKCPHYIKIISEVHNTINNWNKQNMKGLIIDLRKHKGGWYQPFVVSLSSILNNNTLFSFSNKKVKKTDKNWINYSNNTIIYNSMLRNKLNIKIPIAIIIGNKTASSGEICASIFYRNNKYIKIFGDNTYGKLSINNTFNILSNIQLHIPVSLLTSVDGKFHIKEHLEPDIYTNKPIFFAKKWILENDLY